MNEKELKAFQDSLIKELGITIDSAIEAKLKEMNDEGAKSLDEMKEEIKSLSLKFKTQEMKEDGYKGAICAIFKWAFEKGVQSDEEFKSFAETTLKNMNEGTEADWGYLVFDQFERDIIKEIQTAFPIVGAIRWFTLKKGDKVSFPVVDNGITTAYVDEWASGSASKPTFGRVSIDIYKTFSLVDITEELLADYMGNQDLYSLILELIVESQGKFLEKEFVNGTGTGASKIVGMRNLPWALGYALNATKKVADITLDEVLDIEQKLPEKYRRNRKEVKWIITDYVYFVLRKVRHSGGGQLLFPELGNIDNPKLDLFDVVISDEAGDVVSSATNVADAEIGVLGNVKKFYWVRRTGMITKKGYYGDNWKKDVSSIKTTQRVWGKAVRENAFVVFSNGSAS